MTSIAHEKPSGYENIVKTTRDKNHLNLLVHGYHCAACIHQIEGSLLREDDVEQARLNFSNGRLTIQWSGDKNRANDFVSVLENLGYGIKPFHQSVEKKHHEDESRFLLLCIGVAGFAMGNIMLLSVGLWTTSIETMGFATREFLHWISALIAIPAVLYSGRPFFHSAFNALKNKRTNMDVPIAIALILVIMMSLFETINGGEHVYFDSSVMLMFFLLIGRYLDFRARSTAKNAAFDLLSGFSDFATIIENGQTKKQLVSDLQPGMIVRVASGEKIPVDGMIIAGKTTLDTALVTGETMPQEAQENDPVYAGTINLSNPIDINVQKALGDTLLADMTDLMENAKQSHAHYVRLADKAARAYTPVVHLMAALAFLFWWTFMGVAWQESLMIAITVLIITCPCALGLAVPVVQLLASSRLMKNGILLKSGDALERLVNIDHIFIDKTGTLTTGQLSLMPPYHDDVLLMAASLAAHSTHPLSRALLNAVPSDKELIPFTQTEEIPGMGVKGHYKNREYRIGNQEWCGVHHDDNSPHIHVWFTDGETNTHFTFSDSLKTDAAYVVSFFKSKNITPFLVSGDRQKTASAIASQCGIDHVFASLKPHEKYDLMKKSQAQNHRVLMVGDGLNDSACLMGADVSMAPGNAVDVSKNAADIVFMGDGLTPVQTAYQTAVKTHSLIKQNFALAIIYNACAIPLAFAGYVTPLIAAVAMSGSSLLVVLNSFRLK